MTIYKYLPPERIDVLQRRRIRYTQPGAFNDLFETRPGSTKIVDDDYARESVEDIWSRELQQTYAKLPPEIKAILPADLLAAFAEPYKSEFRKQVPDLLALFTPLARGALSQVLNRAIGILTLTEKCDNLLMWSHYSDSHRGFVIGFDSAHKYFDQRISPEDDLRHLRKVEYRTHRPTGPLSTLDAVDIFLVKSADWEYEQEWRIIRPLGDASETISASPFPICLFEYPPAALVEVILGARMQESARTAVLASIRGSIDFSHVKVLEAIPDEVESRVVRRPVGI